MIGQSLPEFPFRPMLSVSVIIPAYNAADTLAETIAALLAQTYPHWEAIVVDDGSTDETAAIVTRLAQQDARIRLITQANAGVCTARNVGIAAAQFDWLLFNDADDWIAPDHLAKMTAALAADPTCDAVHCGWSRVAANGTIGPAKYGPASPDLFPELASYCTFHVNTCIIRKALVAAVSGFDVDVAYCEDWDLWQRIARMGARFQSIREVLSFYRMRQNSLSSHVYKFCRDGLRVLRQGHQADHRVKSPQLAYEFGISSEPLPTRQFYLVNWCAGLLIGRGEDARSLLELVKLESLDPHPSIALEPEWIVENLWETVPIPTHQTNHNQPPQWSQFYPLIQQFLQALADRSGLPSLTDRTLYLFDQKVIQHPTTSLPAIINYTYGITIDITEPITTITLPASAQYLHSQITAAGIELGYLSLPTVARTVTDAVIREAIAAQFTEPIIQLYLQQIGNASPAAFWQQFWQRPDWPIERFYDPDCPDMGHQHPTIAVSNNWIEVDATAELPYLQVLNRDLRVGLRFGVERIGAISFASDRGVITPQQLRSAFTTSFAPALQRAWVRSRLGRPFDAMINPPSAPSSGGISIVIPAYNAAPYLHQTLESVLAQTEPNWEIIIIDDGSTDQTATIAGQFAQRDSRIRLIRQANQGGCAARNHGLRQAYFEWVVFLDADDWWEPTYLAKMTAQLRADPTLDAVRCHYERVTADGTVPLETSPVSPTADVFRDCVLACGFQVDTCIVRRSVIEAIAGFDIAQAAAQDWDLWQRVARTGARFGIVAEVLSYYRSVPSSVSSQGLRLLQNGLKVIERGYAIDPRVLYPDPRYATGLAPATQPMMTLYFMLWCAGLEIVQGNDARSLLALVPEASDPTISPTILANSLRSLQFANGLSPDRWYSRWPFYETPLMAFLAALELHLQMPGLAAPTIAIMQQQILKHAPLPQILGDVQWMDLDITQSVPDITSSADRLYCFVNLAGEPIGAVELPIVQGAVSAELLADVIAGEYFWWILGHFFRANVYTLAEPEQHDQIGWTKLLQELFAQPDRDSAWFYNPTADQTAPLLTLEQPHCQIEISQDLPTLNLNLDAETISVLLTVGGKALGVIPVPVNDRQVSVALLRLTLLNATGLELCRVVVREAIVGQPLQTGDSLRTRLQQAAIRNHEPIDPNTIAPIGSCWRRVD